jgi:glycosyltransferase involved in cell wall biosynthesis
LREEFMRSIHRICLTPRVHGVGGMVSFQHKFAAGLQARGIEVSYDLNDTPYDAVLVIGGTRQLAQLWRVKNRGIPVIQRLNGMNWLHRKLRTGLRHYIRAEYSNWILSTIRSRIATGVIYQSRFALGWWESVYGLTPIPNSVVHNGVDLTTYTPEGPGERQKTPYRLLMVEGSLAGGYETGLETGVQLAETLAKEHHLPVELQIVGKVSEQLKTSWQSRTQVPIRWAGLVEQDAIPKIDRSAHLLYSADLNAACPNSVVEALACGLPVAAFATGALREMVTGEAGRVVAYGGDPWELDPPDIPALAEASAEILKDQDKFRAAARKRAEDAFSLEDMVDKYLEALSG